MRVENETGQAGGLTGESGLAERVSQANHTTGTECGQLLAAALSYAARGWAVFPLGYKAKVPLISKKKGGKGVHDATTDADQIRAWWKAAPGANIGLAAGASGLVIVDVDTGKGGFPSWQALTDKHGINCETVTAVTGGGGMHVFYRLPSGFGIGNSAGALGPGLDVRANGGYVVVPPSIHPSGGEYIWDSRLNPDLVEVAPLPEALLGMLQNGVKPAQGRKVAVKNSVGSEYGVAALGLELAALGRAQEGERNDQLNRSAFSLGQLVAGGELDKGEVDSALKAGALNRGLSETEAKWTIASGLASGGKSPRRAPPKPDILTEFVRQVEEPPWLFADEAVPNPTNPGSGRRGLEVLTARELLTNKWPEPVWAIPGLITTGLAILAGRPKVGKSWLALQMTQAVATGGLFMGRRVEKGACLYLALEDPPRRLADRMEKQGWADLDAPADFLTVGSLRAGGGDRLAEIIREKAYRLVVIDTLSRALVGDQNDSQEMTAALTPLQEAAHAVGCAVLLVDHHNKVGAATRGGDTVFEADPMVNLLGSIAKGAMADCVIGMYRNKGKPGAMLVGTGRDIEDFRLTIAQDGITHCWQLAGDDAPAEITDARAEVLDALESLGGMATQKEIQELTGKDKGSLFRILKAMVAADLVRKNGRNYINHSQP